MSNLSTMYYGAIQICGERVGTSEAKEFCEALDAHKIKMLSLRECGVSTKNFKKLMDSMGYCKSILHMNLNLCGIHCQDRVDMLAAALNMNRSLTALLLHGNHFGTEGVLKIVRPLILHPTITCLDVGDCDLSDRGLKSICELLPPDGDKPGLQELVLSGNPKITPRAWEKFSVALAACSTLRSLYVDFNNVGEAAGKMLIVVAAGHRSLSVLDMEACDLTECVARLLLYLLHHYPTSLSHVLLEENDICDETKYGIRIALGESESDVSSSDDGACEAKQPKCKKENKTRRTRKPEICSSDEEDMVCVTTKQKVTIPACEDNQYVIKKKCIVPTEKRCITKPNDTCVVKKRRSSLKSSKTCTDSSEVEETVAKLKIQLEEASDSSDCEVLEEKSNLDVMYEFKADDISQGSSCRPSCQMRQEVVQRDGKDYLHIHGDCEGGTVKVRLRSRSREPQQCESTKVKCCEKSDSKRSRSKSESVDCTPTCTTTDTATGDECVTVCRRPVDKGERYRMSNKSRSRSRGTRHPSRTSRHRGSLGLQNASLWSDEEEADDACKKEDLAKCGRSPWCGKGVVSQPLRPLQRLAYPSDSKPVPPPRASTLGRRSTTSKPDNNNVELTDTNVSEIKTDPINSNNNKRRSTTSIRSRQPSINAGQPNYTPRMSRISENNIIPTVTVNRSRRVSEAIPSKYTQRDEQSENNILSAISILEEEARMSEERRESRRGDGEGGERGSRSRKQSRAPSRRSTIKRSADRKSGDYDRKSKEYGRRSKDYNRRSRDYNRKSSAGRRRSSRRSYSRSKSRDESARSRRGSSRRGSRSSRDRFDQQDESRLRAPSVGNNANNGSTPRTSRAKSFLTSLKNLFTGADVVEQKAWDNDAGYQSPISSRQPEVDIQVVGDNETGLDLFIGNTAKKSNDNFDIYVGISNNLVVNGNAVNQPPPVLFNQQNVILNLQAEPINAKDAILPSNEAPCNINSPHAELVSVRTSCSWNSLCTSAVDVRNRTMSKVKVSNVPVVVSHVLSDVSIPEREGSNHQVSNDSVVEGFGCTTHIISKSMTKELDDNSGETLGTSKNRSTTITLSRSTSPSNTFPAASLPKVQSLTATNIKPGLAHLSPKEPGSLEHSVSTLVPSASERKRPLVSIIDPPLPSKFKSGGQNLNFGKRRQFKSFNQSAVSGCAKCDSLSIISNSATPGNPSNSLPRPAISAPLTTIQEVEDAQSPDLSRLVTDAPALPLATDADDKGQSVMDNVARSFTSGLDLLRCSYSNSVEDESESERYYEKDNTEYGRASDCQCVSSVCVHQLVDDPSSTQDECEVGATLLLPQHFNDGLVEFTSYVEATHEQTTLSVNMECVETYKPDNNPGVPASTRDLDWVDCFGV